MNDVFESLREVDALIARRKFGRAIDLLRAAASARPTEVGLRLRLAEALAADGQSGEAAQLLEAVATELAQQGFSAKAVAVLKKLQRLGGGSESIEDRLAELIRLQQESLAPLPRREPSAESPALPAGLARSPLFSSFDREELAAIIRGLRLHGYQAGQVLVSESEPGDSLFVLASGSARVYVAGPDHHQREVRRLEAGDIFGEISLLTGSPRTATVIAAVECEVLELDRSAVLGIAAHHPAVRATLERICRERADSAEEQSARGVGFRPAVEAETDDLALPAETPAPSLTPVEIAALLPYCSLVRRDEGATLFARGDSGDHLFVIERGEVEVRFEQRRPAKRLGPGEVFGELALLSAGRRRTATAVAAGDCRLIAIDREAWQALATARPALVFKLIEQSCAYLVESEQRLVTDLRRRNRELERALEFLQRTRQELTTAEALAQTDELTGIFNRRCFEEQIRTHCERAPESGLQVALLLVDVDHFKRVNDNQGHQVGDLVLRRLAQLLQAAVRWSDLPCRIGGDEFAVLWTDLDPRAAARRAQEMRPLLAAFEIAGSPANLAVSASLGGALLRPGESWREFFARADRGLYLAKRSGRGRLAWEELLVDDDAGAS